MTKNPFVNCKSRKRRKPRAVTKPQPKGFCPRTMVRYDNSPNEYKTAWVCKMCLKFLLSENACNDHLEVCNTKSFNKSQPTPKSVDDIRYKCDYCLKEFSRKVTLKKHMEQHENSSSGPESEDENNIVFDENEAVTENHEDMVDGCMIDEDVVDGYIIDEDVVDEDVIIPTVVDENLIMPIVVDEPKTVAIIGNENECMLTLDKENESVLIVVDENNMIDENVMIDGSKKLVDENKTEVDKELSQEMDVDSEKDMGENPTN